MMTAIFWAHAVILRVADMLRVQTPKFTCFSLLQNKNLEVTA